VNANKTGALKSTETALEMVAVDLSARVSVSVAFTRRDVDAFVGG